MSLSLSSSVFSTRDGLSRGSSVFSTLIRKGGRRVERVNHLIIPMAFSSLRTLYPIMISSISRTLSNCFFLSWSSSNFDYPLFKMWLQPCLLRIIEWNSHVRPVKVTQRRSRARCRPGEATVRLLFFRTKSEMVLIFFKCTVENTSVFEEKKREKLWKKKIREESNIISGKLSSSLLLLQQPFSSPLSTSVESLPVSIPLSSLLLIFTRLYRDEAHFACLITTVHYDWETIIVDSIMSSRKSTI